MSRVLLDDLVPHFEQTMLALDEYSCRKKKDDHIFGSLDWVNLRPLVFFYVPLINRVVPEQRNSLFWMDSSPRGDEKHPVHV